MIILGIDPGSRKTGYAVIEQVGKKSKYLASGVIRFDHIDSFIDRLSLIYSECEKLLEIYSPDEIAFESLIYVKNVNSLAKLAQARGAMIAALTKLRTGTISEYSPNLIKSCVSGHGHASKESVEKMLKMIFGEIKFKTNDESDALAIALCHSLNRETKNKSVGEKASGGRTLRSLYRGKS